MDALIIDLVTIFAEVVLAWYFFSAALHPAHGAKRWEFLYYLGYGLLLVFGTLCISFIPLKLLVLIAFSLLGNRFVYRPKWLSTVYITALFYCASIIADVIAGGDFFAHRLSGAAGACGQ